MLTKTRSCENLCPGAPSTVEMSSPNRRLSDPNVSIGGSPEQPNATVPPTQQSQAITASPDCSSPHVNGSAGVSEATENDVTKNDVENNDVTKNGDDVRNVTEQGLKSDQESVTASMNGHAIEAKGEMESNKEGGGGPNNGEEDSIAKVHVPESLMKNGGQDTGANTDMLKCVVYSRKSETAEIRDSSDDESNAICNEHQEQLENSDASPQNIPLSSPQNNENEDESDMPHITPDMLKRISTSTGSDTTLVEQPGITEEHPEIADDCRTLCGSDNGGGNGQIENNGVEAPSVSSAATSINGHDANSGGVPPDMVNGHCDTRETCSTTQMDRKSARLENGCAVNGHITNGHDTSCDNKSMYNGGDVSMKSKAPPGKNSQLPMCNGNVRTSHASQTDVPPRMTNGYHYDSSIGSTPTETRKNGFQNSVAGFQNGVAGFQNGGAGFQNGGAGCYNDEYPALVPLRNNIRSLRAAANMSTSTSDISDSQVSIKTNFVTGIVKGMWSRCL